MKIAIPSDNGKVGEHFGHAKEFCIFEVDVENKKIISETQGVPPPHAPGVLPEWLKNSGVDVAIAANMGPAAQNLLEKLGVKAVIGAMGDSPAAVAQAYIDGSLAIGENSCDHGH